MKTLQPQTNNTALEIVRVAKTDRARAEELVLNLMDEIAPELGIRLASINKNSVVSLNSVNGRLSADGKKYFFKFHAEEGEVETLKDSEYYNAKMLAEYGWPMVQPIFASSTPGSQCVVYDYIDAPVAYDLYAEEDARYLQTGAYDDARVTALLKAEEALADIIRDGFLKSLALSQSDEIKKTSLNQLFYNRLSVTTSEGPPRLERFYKGKLVKLPNGESVPFDELANMHWEINGSRFKNTLNDIIAQAKKLLNPSNEDRVPSVVGHGDDHNGNKFYIGDEFRFYDPAFAGRHPALLSFTKAIAHNVFLHPFWLYEPEKLEGQLKINVALKNGTVKIDHNWTLEDISPLRMRLFAIYRDRVCRPLIARLSERGWLPAYWEEYFRVALFCCPFLVLNLIDNKKYPAPQSLLALSKCVELGSSGNSPTVVDQFIADLRPNV